MSDAEQRAHAVFAAAGLEPAAWSNGPDDRYGAHAHPYGKLLVCVRGSIVFHTDAGDITLTAGDRLDLPAGTQHAATVGPEGVTCWEGHR